MEGTQTMLRASIIFFVIALIAFTLGAYNLAGLSMDIGKLLLYVFLILGVLSLVVSLFTGRNKNLAFLICLVPTTLLSGSLRANAQTNNTLNIENKLQQIL